MHKQLHKELWINLAVVFGTLVLGGTAFFLLSRDVALQAEKTVSARTLISERAATLEALAGLKKEAPRAEAYKAVLDKTVVLEDQLLDLPRWLDNLARGRRVSLEFAFRGERVPPAEQAPGSIGFSANVAGGLANIIGFLKDIEVRPSRFLLGLGGFSLVGGDGGYRLESDGKAYFR